MRGFNKVVLFLGMTFAIGMAASAYALQAERMDFDGDHVKESQVFYEKGQIVKVLTDINGDGQLAVNVYQTDNDLVLQTAVAGVKAEELDVIIEDEIITIKGNRPNPLQESGDYFIEECYWGPFSRSIILPVEVRADETSAVLRSGVLTITLPKRNRSTIPVREIE